METIRKREMRSISQINGGFEMKFSLIVPFQRGTDYLRDCLESIKQQKRRIYSEEEDYSSDRFDMDAQPALEAVTDSGLTADDKPLSNEDPLLALLPEKDYESAPYRDFEVVLVTDSPVDDISGLVLEYGREFNLRTIELKEGTGVGAARNLGMANAKGEYIFFLDSDDYLFDEALYFMAQAVEDAEAPDILYGKKIWTWYSRNGFLALWEEKRKKKLAEKLEYYKAEARKANRKLSEEEILKLAEEALRHEDELKAELEGEEDSEADDSAEDQAEDKLSGEEYLAMTLSEDEYREHRRDQAAKRLISKRKGIRNVSALNIAFKRSLIEDNGLRFTEELRYYADFPFVCEALSLASTFRKCYRCRYVKRKHGDPINFPSLAQEKSEERFSQLLAAFRLAKAGIAEGSSIAYRADKKLINYYTNYYVTRLRRSENETWRTDRFEMMRDVFTLIPAESVEHFGRYKKKLVAALLANDAEKTLSIVSKKLFWRKLWKCLLKRSAMIQAFYVNVFLKKPVKKDTILFECFFGKSYGDSPRAIYEYISKTYPGKFNMVWSMEKPLKAKIPYKHKTVKHLMFRYSYYIARSKYFVFNTKQPTWMRKREDQVFLETWHGTPLKRLAFDMEDNFSAFPGYKKHIYSKTRSWDYLIAANSFSSEVFKSCFMFDNKMLEYGYPRNDILHSEDRDEYATKIRKKLNIPLDKKTILYAPTWRDDEYYEAGKYKFQLKLDLPKMKAALSDEYVILLRTHYYIADKLDVTGMEGFAYNLSKYPDIADIYLISDICITDYSSVFFDYANLKRPLIFYTYDIDKYRDMLRGFYFDMEATVPGPLVYTTEEVIDTIRHIDESNARFAERYDAFYERFCGWEDGHASENIVNEVFAEALNPVSIPEHDEEQEEAEEQEEHNEE